MKDYVTQVKEIQPFIEALLDDYNSETPSGYVYLNDNDEPKLNFSKTGVIPTDGISTVAIVRINEDQKAWFEVISPHAKILGEALEQHIKNIDDVNWITSGKMLYHSIYKQDPMPDGEGGFITPSLLHCVLAS